MGCIWQRLPQQSVSAPLVSRRATFTALCARGARIDLPPLNGTTSRERIWGFDAAPNLVPVELLAMLGRLLGMPSYRPRELRSRR